MTIPLKNGLKRYSFVEKNNDDDEESGLGTTQPAEAGNRA